MATLDKNGTPINVGDKVVWYDPEVEYRDTTRLYEVYKVAEELVYIFDDCSEGEVLPNEVEVVK